MQEESTGAAALTNSNATESCELKPSPWTKNIVGKIFSRLTVVSYKGKDKHSNSLWTCKCDCGSEVITSSKKLREGDAKSCGCLAREYRASLRTHGKTNTSEFKIWGSILTRVKNPKYHSFELYGGRGIGISEEWSNSFEAFLRDMGPRPSPKHSVERIDVNGNYCKENCRWATQREQCRNKRTNHLVTYKGETLPLVVWTERLGFRKTTLRNRLVSGWSIEMAMTEPEKEKVLRSPRKRKTL